MLLFHDYSSRRLLQKNAAFLILLSFLLLYTSEPAWLTSPIAVDAPLNYFTVMGKLMVNPQGPTYYNFCFNKQGLGIHLWYQSEAFIRLVPFDSRVSSDSSKFTIAAIEEVSPDYLSQKPSVKSNACLCARILEQFC